MKDKLLDINEMSIWDDAKHMLEKARKDGVETAWDRLAQQTPHCRFCELGTTCRNCVMGPCRISAKAEPGGKLSRGVCGADADVIVARNFGRFIAGGSTGHSDHGRDVIETLEAVVEGKAANYQIRDVAKLTRIAAELGAAPSGSATGNELRGLIRRRLKGEGCPPVENWLPRYFEFPSRGYTDRTVSEARAAYDRLARYGDGSVAATASAGAQTTV